MNRQGEVCLDVHLINMRKIDRCWLQVTTPYFFSCRPVWKNCRYPAIYSAFVPISLSCFPLCSLFHNCFFLAYQATAFHDTSLITAIQRRARSDMPCCFPAVRFGLAGSASPIPFRRKDLPTWFHLLCGRLEAFGRPPEKTMPNPVRFAHHVRVSYRVGTFASLKHPTTPLGYLSNRSPMLFWPRALSFLLRLCLVETQKKIRKNLVNLK